MCRGGHLPELSWELWDEDPGRSSPSRSTPTSRAVMEPSSPSAQQGWGLDACGRGFRGGNCVACHHTAMRLLLAPPWPHPTLGTPLDPPLRPRAVLLIIASLCSASSNPPLPSAESCTLSPSPSRVAAFFFSDLRMGEATRDAVYPPARNGLIGSIITLLHCSPGGHVGVSATKVGEEMAGGEELCHGKPVAATCCSNLGEATRMLSCSASDACTEESNKCVLPNEG